MMYRYLTLNDGTEVVHSDMMPDGRVKVFVYVHVSFSGLSILTPCI